MITVAVQNVFDEHKAKHAMLDEKIDEIKRLYVDKLWHPITEKLIDFS